MCGGDCGGERFVYVLRLLRRRLDKCAASIAAADELMSNRLRAAAIAAAPHRICGGNCGGGQVAVYSCGSYCGGGRVEVKISLITAEQTRRVYRNSIVIRDSGGCIYLW